MRFASMRVAAAVLGVAFLTIAVHPTIAQGTDPKATEQRPAGENGKDGSKKPDEYAEAEKLLGGPAANPECMWLGNGWSACCGATISIPPSATSTSTTGSAVRPATSKLPSAASCGRETSIPRRRIRLVHASIPAGSIPIPIP